MGRTISRSMSHHCITPQERRCKAIAARLTLASDIATDAAGVALWSWDVDTDEIYRGTDCGSYWARAEIRCALRSACQQSGQLTSDIRAAFGSAPALLLEDWFGIADRQP